MFSKKSVDSKQHNVPSTSGNTNRLSRYKDVWPVSKIERIHFTPSLPTIFEASFESDSSDEPTAEGIKKPRRSSSEPRKPMNTSSFEAVESGEYALKKKKSMEQLEIDSTRKENASLLAKYKGFWPVFLIEEIRSTLSLPCISQELSENCLYDEADQCSTKLRRINSSPYF